MTLTGWQQTSPAVEQPTKEHQRRQQLISEWTRDAAGLHNQLATFNPDFMREHRPVGC